MSAIGPLISRWVPVDDGRWELELPGHVATWNRVVSAEIEAMNAGHVVLLKGQLSDGRGRPYGATTWRGVFRDRRDAERFVAAVWVQP